MGGPVKLILLALAAVAAWYGYRWWRAKVAAEIIARDKARTIGEELQPCRICGTYVAAATVADCGRAGCPYPRRKAV
jgi:hypothetical protein